MLIINAITSSIVGNSTMTFHRSPSKIPPDRPIMTAVMLPPVTTPHSRGRTKTVEIKTRICQLDDLARDMSCPPDASGVPVSPPPCGLVLRSTGRGMLIQAASRALIKAVRLTSPNVTPPPRTLDRRQDCWGVRCARRHRSGAARHTAGIISRPTEITLSLPPQPRKSSSSLRLSRRQ